MKKPRILVTNDDGIHAPGIAVMERIARTISDDVWVVAPDQERSGAGHSVSISQPIRMRELDDRHFQIAGTPTDCVLMAVSEILTDRRPDIVLSGVNSGANLAEDVSYSGTIAAAMEGTLLGMRAIAISQLRAADRSTHFAACEAHAPGLVQQLLAQPDWPADAFININIPHAAPDAISGVRLTSQGQRPPGSFTIDARIDARAEPYYWVKIAYTDGEKAADTDLHAIAELAISVTPIRMNFTDEAWRGALQNALRL